MSCAKFNEDLHQLRFSPRFLWNFQSTQSLELHVDVAHLSRRLANPVQHLQQLFVLAIVVHDQFFQKRLQAPRGRAETMHGFGPVAGGEPEEFFLRLSEDGFATFRRNRHS